MSEVKTTIEKHEGGFTICNPYASKIKFTCLDGEVIEVRADYKNIRNKSLNI